MVIAKPIQLTNVSAVPFNSGVTEVATRLENWGESAVTAIPHKHQPNKKIGEGNENKIGEIKHSKPDIDNANIATFLLPIFCDTIPPNAQDTPPRAIIIPVHNGTDITLPVSELNQRMAIGVNAQNA